MSKFSEIIGHFWVKFWDFRIIFQANPKKPWKYPFSAWHDSDNSGFLEIKEIKKALEDLAGDFQIQPSDKEVREIINEIDTDKDAKLNLQEFIDLHDQIKESGDAIRTQFDYFDRNGDGKVNRAELKKALGDLNEQLSSNELKRMIKDADVDGDGEIDFNEFQKILTMSC